MLLSTNLRFTKTKYPFSSIAHRIRKRFFVLFFVFFSILLFSFIYSYICMCVCVAMPSYNSNSSVSQYHWVDKQTEKGNKKKKIWEQILYNINKAIRCWSVSFSYKFFVVVYLLYFFFLFSLSIQIDVIVCSMVSD